MIEVIGVVREVYKRTFVLTRDGRELKKREFTIEPDDDSDGEVYFVLFPTMWYDPVDDIKTGDRVKVVFSARSRKYNGKYYTTLTAKKVEKMVEDK